MASSDETPDQVLLRLSRQMEDVIRSISELMSRQNAMDGQVSSLLSQNAAAGASRPNGATSAFPDENRSSDVNSGLLRSTAESGWKAIRYRKLYLDTVPMYDGKASGWSNFITKLRLTMDQSYEWAPIYLRMSEMLESAQLRKNWSLGLNLLPSVMTDRTWWNSGKISGASW